MGFLDGNIRQYLFYNEENSYSVIKVEIIDTDEPELSHFEPTITICGFFPRLELYQTYRFHGVVSEHQKYGIQYSADRFERIREQTASGIIDYLSSDLFKGIGPKTAEAIVGILGIEALDKIADDPSVLNEIPRMNAEKKAILSETIRRNRAMESALVWLYGFSISPKMAMKIYQRFGFAAIETVRNNPYSLIDEIEGIGFRRADEIALKIGFAYDDPLRIEAIIVFLLTEYMNKYGDTYVESDELMNYTINYLNQGDQFQIKTETVDKEIEKLENSGKLVKDGNRVSLMAIYYSEKGIADSLKEYFVSKNEAYDEEMIAGYLEAFEKSRHIQYTDKQKKAIMKALTESFTIITGGPGTGKTTVIDAICHVYMMMRQSNRNFASAVKLAAPTGKAAKRLQDATDLEATTIHRLLGYDYEGHFTKDRHSPLEAGLLVIDEASMMDVILANHLFQSLSDGTKVVIVGDDNQLPSVGPGQVLTDLMASDQFTTVGLDMIHRQASGSSIVKLAYSVLEGTIEESVFHDKDDLFFYGVPDEKIADFVVGLIRRYLREGYNLQEDIQILAPVYKGNNGIDRLNKIVQETFNKHNEGHKLTYKDKTFRFNDKVMQLVNQPEDGIMNGDIGYVSGIIEDKELLVDFGGNTVKYDIRDFDNLTLAYCISIHKSQGSEFNVVLMPMSRSYRIMLKKKLIYTGITRAKQLLSIIGEKDALRIGIYGNETPRKTRLRDFLALAAKSGNDDCALTIEDFL
ncbi:MAG TPA: ATP-dependent RecD-like DNA helicase [Bacillota bacterium]|nr:ATP-dependent RecD-like DNA helicase [Bacillota bacterium]